MKNCMKIGLSAAVLLSVVFSNISAQTAAKDDENFFVERQRYQKQLEEKEKLKGKEKERNSGEEKEDLPQLNFERWNWYWRDRLDLSSDKPGQKADVGLYMRSFYYATSGVTPPSNTSSTERGNNTSSILTLSSPICSSGSGNWSCIGPGTATTTHPAPVMGLVSAIYTDPAVANAQHLYIGTRGGGVFETTNGGTSWNNLMDASRMPATDILSIAVDPTNPSVIYVASDFEAPGDISDFAHQGSYGFGVLKTTNGGATWTEVLTLSNFYTTAGVRDCIRAIKIHPQNNNVIYALGEYKAFMSTDAGATWQIIEDIPPTGGPNGCANQTRHIEIIPGATGVSDSYVMITTLATGWSMNGNYGCNPSRVLVSSIGGALIGTSFSFTDVTASVLGADYTEEIAIALQPGTPNDFFLCYLDLNAAQLHLKKYNTSGTVTSIGSGPDNPASGLSMFQFVFSKNNPNIYFIGGQTLYRYDITASGGGLSGGGNPFSAYSATTGCNTPDVHYTHGDIRSLAITTSGTNDILLMGDDGGIQKLVFNPSTVTNYPIWTNINGAGLNTSAFFWLASSENNYNALVAGTQDNGFFEFNSGTWSLRLVGDGYRGAIKSTSSSNTYYGNLNYLAYGGAIGNPCYSTAGVTYPGLFMYRGNAPLVSNPYHTDTLYTVGLTGSGQCLYISPDFGATWSPVPFFPPTARNIRSIRISPSNPNVIYVVKEGPTWMSNLSDMLFRVTYNPSTATWSCQDLQGVTSANPLWIMQWASVTDIAIDALNSNHIFVSINGYDPVSPTSLAGKDRVFESTDGGTNWYGITDNMLAFPVNTIVYQGGTDDVLYAGTDVGVFRYNKNNPAGSKWECFMNGLPVTPVTDLEINHCKNKIRAATYGRSAWESDLPPINTGTGQIVVNTNANWNTNRRLTSDVFVTANSNLTVSATVYMSAGKKIIVDKGSTLTIAGTGKLTNCCGDMWLGVEVWGTPGASQVTAGAQGKVILQSGCIVENCSEGIVTAKNIGGTPDMSYTGGIIQGIGANFYNNKRDVVFYPYQYSIANNYSYLKNCTFETNAQLGNALSPDMHVKMDGVKNILLLGNRYRNTTSTTIYSANFRGTGVYSTNSQYSLDDYSTISSNVFDGLTTGVSGNFTVGTVKSSNVYNTDFNNVQRGVEINYSYSSTVSNCTFTNVPLSQTFNFVDATWAVRVNNATVFYVINNSMTGASPPYQNNYGVIVDNCGSNAGVVSGNTIKDLYAGIQAQGSNGSGANGVQFKCNNLQQQLRYQISVCPITAGTLADQGSGCTLSNTRQNNFYVSAIPNCNQISVGIGTSFSYYASGTVPIYTCGSVSVVSCSAVTGECSGGGGGGGSRLANDTATTTASTDGLINSLLALNTKDSRVTLTGVYINTGRLSEAYALVNSFRNEKGMEDVVSYYDIMLSLERNHGQLNDLNNQQLDLLENIADGKSAVALSAQVILSETRGKTYARITEHFDEDKSQQTTSALTENSVLSDNMPNPFDNSTMIKCNVAADVNNAALVITSVDGKIIRIISLTTGENNVTIEASGLSSGIYYYTLKADGKNIATKRMVIVRD